MRLKFNRSALILAAALIACPVSAAIHIPPFCVILQLPPASCKAEKALPCTGACPADISNNPAAWLEYWEGCQQPTGSGDFSLAQKQFMCDAPGAGELHVVYYNPSGTYVCCAKNPFSDEKGDKNPPATGDQKLGQ